MCWSSTGPARTATAAIAGAAAAELGRVEVFDQGRKSGLGAAYRYAFGVGLGRGYDVIVQMDADLSHDPADIPRLLQGLANGADLVIGSRYVPGGGIEAWSRSRRRISRLGNRYAGRMLRVGVEDLTAGFRAYRASTLRAIRPERSRANGYAFQIEMAYRVLRVGGRVVEIPIVFADRHRGSVEDVAADRARGGGPGRPLGHPRSAVGSPPPTWPTGSTDAGGVGRSVELFRRFRREQSDPDQFYEYLADDTVRMLEPHLRLDGAVAVDVGGGAGYAAAALRRAGARCVVVEPDHQESDQLRPGPRGRDPGGRRPAADRVGDRRAVPQLERARARRRSRADARGDAARAAAPTGGRVRGVHQLAVAVGRARDIAVALRRGPLRRPGATPGGTATRPRTGTARRCSGWTPRTSSGGCGADPTSRCCGSGPATFPAGCGG